MADMPPPQTAEEIETLVEYMRALAAFVDDHAVSEEHQALADAWTDLDRALFQGAPYPAEWARHDD